MFLWLEEIQITNNKFKNLSRKSEKFLTCKTNIILYWILMVRCVLNVSLHSSTTTERMHDLNKAEVSASKEAKHGNDEGEDVDKEPPWEDTKFTVLPAHGKVTEWWEHNSKRSAGDCTHQRDEHTQVRNHLCQDNWNQEYSYWVEVC